MSADTDWGAVADSVYREFVEDERREKANQHLEELQDEIARLRAEVEGLRFAASEVADFLVCLPGMSESDVEIVASRLIERIDAAMGASA